MKSKECLIEIGRIVKKLNGEFEHYQQQIEVIPPNLSQPDLLDYQAKHLPVIDYFFQLIESYYQLNQLNKGGADKLAAAMETDIRKDNNFPFLYLSEEEWDRVGNLLMAYHNALPDQNLTNPHYCQVLNGIGFLPSLQMITVFMLKDKKNKQDEKKKQIFHEAITQLENDYLDEVNQHIENDDFLLVQPSYTEAEIDGFKLKYHDNKIMQIKLDQYKAAKEVRETLEDDTKPVEEQLKNFSAAHQKNMPIFKQRRTEAYDKFCKIIGSVLLCATVVGAFFVPKLWKTKGHKYENKINPVLKSMAAAN